MVRFASTTVLISHDPLARLIRNDFRQRRKPFKTGVKARKVLSNINWDENVLERANHLLSDLMRDRPVEVYAVALDLLRDQPKALPQKITQGVKEIARLAARSSLRNPPLGMWTPETNIEYDDYVRFASYHRKCSVRLLIFLATEVLIQETATEWIWHDAECKMYSPTPSPPGLTLEAAKHPVAWWTGYWERIVASIGDCPCQDLFENDQIWDSTLPALKMECPTCYETAVKNYPRFKQKVVQIVTGIIDEVSIHFTTYLPANGLISTRQVEREVEREVLR